MNEMWINLLRRIPVKHHDNLGLVTTTGQEIFVQQFYRFDPQYMMMRARLSGSTEGSRVIILPYAHIDYVSFVRALVETEVQEIFGSDGAYTAPVQVAPTPAPVAENADGSVPEHGPEGEALEAAVTSPTAAPVTSGPGVAPMTVGPGSNMKTAPLSARAPNGAAQANGDAGEKVDPSKVSKTLLLARLRERMNQKSR